LYVVQNTKPSVFPLPAQVATKLKLHTVEVLNSCDGNDKNFVLALLQKIGYEM
jgi:hypothetical protein